MGALSGTTGRLSSANVAAQPSRRYSHSVDTQPPQQESQRPASEQWPRQQWWQNTNRAGEDDCHATPREGLPCPSCLLGTLHFNGLFQLICDTCERVAEAGVFT